MCRLGTLFWALHIYTMQWVSVYFWLHGNENFWKIQIWTWNLDSKLRTIVRHALPSLIKIGLGDLGVNLMFAELQRQQLNVVEGRRRVTTLIFFLSSTLEGRRNSCSASGLLWFPFDLLNKWQQSRNKTWTELVEMWRTDASKIRKESHNRSIINCKTVSTIQRNSLLCIYNKIIIRHIAIYNLTYIAILTRCACNADGVRTQGMLTQFLFP